MAALSEKNTSTVLGCKGSAAVEFALVLPVLLIVLFGTVEYGWYLTYQLVLTNAVSEGARMGVSAREWEDEDPVEMAREAAVKAFWLLPEDQSQLFEASLQAEIVENDTDELRTLEVGVSQYAYTPLTGFLPAALMPENLNAKAVMAFPR